MSTSTGTMMPDVQELVYQTIFQGELARDTLDGPGPQFYIDGMETFFYNFDLSYDVVKPALVCKKWNQAYKDWLQGFFEKQDVKLRQTAVANGLAMCGLARYGVDDAFHMEEHTEELHTVMLHFGRHIEMNMLMLHLTRWKADDAEEHTLAVEYWPKAQLAGGRHDMRDFFRQKNGPFVDILEDMPVRLAQIPQVCFVKEEELMQAQREQIEQWKQDFAELTALWLPTQRDAPGQAGAIEEWRREFGAWRKAWLDAQISDDDYAD